MPVRSRRFSATCATAALPSRHPPPCAWAFRIRTVPAESRNRRALLSRRATNKAVFSSRLYRHIGAGGAGSRFFRVLGARSDAYRASASDERQQNRKNRPRLRCRPRRWAHHSRRPPPRLARFSPATTPVPICRYNLARCLKHTTNVPEKHGQEG